MTERVKRERVMTERIKREGTVERKGLSKREG